VVFLVGQVYDAFEHWKRLVVLLCGCDAALLRRPQLYLRFLAALHFQLRETPRDFFVDIVAQDNFLAETLQALFARVRAAGPALDPALARRTAQFAQHLAEYFGWDFSAEEDGDPPVVVELDEETRALLLAQEGLSAGDQQ
jgi:A1 cistron-splicing factor AAR2